MAHTVCSRHISQIKSGAGPTLHHGCRWLIPCAGARACSSSLISTLRTSVRYARVARRNLVAMNVARNMAFRRLCRRGAAGTCQSHAQAEWQRRSPQPCTYALYVRRVKQTNAEMWSTGGFGLFSDLHACYRTCAAMCHFTGATQKAKSHDTRAAHAPPQVAQKVPGCVPASASCTAVAWPNRC